MKSVARDMSLGRVWLGGVTREGVAKEVSLWRVWLGRYHLGGGKEGR